MTHFLVTGGAGFVGSHLVDRLVAQGHRVTVLDNLCTGFRENVHQDAILNEGDVRDTALLSRLIAEVDACFHLAAIASVQQCNESWIASHSVNLSAFVGLLESAVQRKGGVIPVVYASSAAVYGDTKVFPVHEDLPLRPLSAYGADKAGCEAHAHAAGRSGGVPTFGLRPFNIYGPRQHASSPYSGVITVFTDRLLRGEDLTIYGDGQQTRDFIHVSDIVEHFIAALDKASPSAPVANAATGKETSVCDIAQRLAAILGREAKIVFAPARAGDIYRSVADTTRACSLLGIKARVDIAEGLRFILKK
ncbi:MAG: NAD-dependent epimerase/dehydratase family protein [Alphaproteobacteria bacterium]|nr:NAD-dependent epimerase/dehydratase family protein [Alphaproteobacteria bacterium]